MEKSTSPSQLLRQPNLAGTSKRIGAIGTFATHALLLAAILYGASFVHTPPPQAEANVPVQLTLTVIDEQAAAPPEPEASPAQALSPEPLPEKEPADPVVEPEEPEQEALRARPKPPPPKRKRKKAPEATQAQQSDGNARQKAENGNKANHHASREAKQTVVSILVAQIDKYKRYPSSARKLGLEGVVSIRVTIDAQGRITNITFSGGGAHPSLQKAAAETMAKVRGNWKPPSVSQGISVTVPLRFSLRDG